MNSNDIQRAAEILVGPHGHASDVWRAAHPLIVEHGHGASLIAIRRANDHAVKGDVIEALDWLKIFFAIEDWQHAQPQSRESSN